MGPVSNGLRGADAFSSMRGGVGGVPLVGNVTGVYRVRVLKRPFASLGVAIEGGVNTQQALPRIIAIQPEGAAFQTARDQLRVGQLIREVDGRSLAGLPHETAAKVIAEQFARKDRNEMLLIVMDQNLTAAEKRRTRMSGPQQQM